MTQPAFRLDGDAFKDFVVHEWPGKYPLLTKMYATKRDFLRWLNNTPVPPGHEWTFESKSMPKPNGDVEITLTATLGRQPQRYGVFTNIS